MFMRSSTSRRKLRPSLTPNRSGNCITVTGRIRTVISPHNLRICRKNTGEPSVQLVTSTAKNNKNLHYSADLILSSTLQQALQFGFMIAYQVHQNVLPIPAERRKIRCVPAALRHPRRKSTQKAQSLGPARCRQHRSHKAMVSVQDG